MLVERTIGIQMHNLLSDIRQLGNILDLVNDQLSQIAGPMEFKSGGVPQQPAPAPGSVPTLSQQLDEASRAISNFNTALETVRGHLAKQFSGVEQNHTAGAPGAVAYRTASHNLR